MTKLAIFLLSFGVLCGSIVQRKPDGESQFNAPLTISFPYKLQANTKSKINESEEVCVAQSSQVRTFADTVTLVNMTTSHSLLFRDCSSSASPSFSVSMGRMAVDGDAMKIRIIVAANVWEMERRREELRLTYNGMHIAGGAAQQNVSVWRADRGGHTLIFAPTFPPILSNMTVLFDGYAAIIFFDQFYRLCGLCGSLGMLRNGYLVDREQGRTVRQRQRAQSKMEIAQKQGEAQNKHYDTVADEAKQQSGFVNNFIRNIGKERQSLKTSETVTNPHADSRLPEKTAKQGGTRRTLINRHQSKASQLRAPQEMRLPDSIDWRNLGVVSRVKNQGACGSDWAFAATGALEGAHALATGKLVELSVQQLVDCDKFDHGCSNGLPDFAFEELLHEGIDTELSYPYEGVEGECRFNKTSIGSNMKDYVQIETGNEWALQVINI